MLARHKLGFSSAVRALDCIPTTGRHVDVSVEPDVTDKATGAVMSDGNGRISVRVVV